MNLRRILATITLVIGLGLIGFSEYIKMEVAKGNLEVSDAQKKVNQGNFLFSLSPYTKSAGKELTGSAQKQIDAGKEDINHYSELARELEIAGIIVAVLGIIVFCIPRQTKYRQH